MAVSESDWSRSNDEETLNIEKMDLNDEMRDHFRMPEIRHIFPLIANFLDIKSFMRLALASKEMYNMCMEDNRVKIDVKEDQMRVEYNRDGPEFLFQSARQTNEFLGQYVAKLRQLNCNVHLREFCFASFEGEIDDDMVIKSKELLKEIGVKKIENLTIRYMNSGWKEILSFAQEFGVNEMKIDITAHQDLPESILQSFLQLNLLSFTFNGPVPSDILLRVDSRISRIQLPGLRNISNDEIMQILGKLQRGAFSSLVVNLNAVNWNPYNPLDFGYDEPLPDERPLVFLGEAARQAALYFILHSDGNVTKCQVSGMQLEFSKCEPSEFPPALRSKEEIFRELDENNPRTPCTIKQFHSFFASKDILEPSLKGLLPEERPLLFKTDKPGYLILNEDETVDEYVCSGGYSRRSRYDLRNNWPNDCDHPALAMHIFRKILKGCVPAPRIYSNDFEGFQCWLEDFKRLPYDYTGPLPEERPLIFEKHEKRQYDDFFHDDERRTIDAKCFVVLFEDDSVILGELFELLYLVKCPPCRLPSALISKESLKEILLEKRENDLELRLCWEIFTGAFDGFKTVPFDYAGALPDEQPLVFEEMELNNNGVKQRWFLHKNVLTKCVWNNGRAVFTKADLERPPLLKSKEYFRRLIERLHKAKNRDEILLWFGNLRDFESFFEEFKMFPVFYRDPLPSDRPLVFCDGRSTRIFLRNDGTMIRCHWRYSSIPRAEISLCSRYSLPRVL